VRETVAAKARRYLAEGRLIVRALDEAAGTVSADVRGGSAVYTVARTRDTGWVCSCPARGTCCHLTAVQLVVVVESRRHAREAAGLDHGDAGGHDHFRTPPHRHRGGLVSAPRILIVLSVEAPPRVEIEDGAGAVWARLGDWLIGSGLADLLHGLLTLLRQAKETTP